jgi:3',5'-cyclic-nucleotide phosphodiesterase/cAMP-specific phosphodiesterase 4
LALLLSTAAHDLGHPAVNSLFLSNALHPLAMHYSNKAVLENYHCAHFFSFYYRSEFNITSHLSATD